MSVDLKNSWPQHFTQSFCVLTIAIFYSSCGQVMVGKGPTPIASSANDSSANSQLDPENMDSSGKNEADGTDESESSAASDPVVGDDGDCPAAELGDFCVELVSSFYTGPIDRFNFIPGMFLQFMDRLVFLANGDDDLLNELWALSNDTGLARISDSLTHAQNLLKFNDTVYFTAKDPSGAVGQYQVNSDLSVSATTGGPIFHVGRFLSNSVEFMGRLFFAASSSLAGLEIMSYQSDNSISVITDINPGSGNAWPRELVVLGSQLYFMADDGHAAAGSSSWQEIYVYDGSSTPRLICDILEKSDGICDRSAKHFPGQLTAFDGKLYFSAGRTPIGHELYCYDPVANQLHTIDINATESSHPQAFFVFDTATMYFQANGGDSGKELYRLKASSPLSPELVYDYPGSGRGTEPRKLARIANQLVFSGRSKADYLQYVLWVVQDGQEPVEASNVSASNSLIKDPHSFHNLQDSNYMVALDSDGRYKLFRLFD